MKRSIAFAALIVAALWTESAGAQAAYPSKLVRLICWTSAGSPLDVMMRQIGKQFGEMFNQTFVVENRPGGEGVLAMSLLQNSPADGYTILSTTSSMSFAMAASDHMKFGPQDFIILPALQAEPSAVAVRADSPFKTMKQFIDAIRAQPDKISVGGFSSAGFHQYVFYRLQQVGGFKSIWVPFKGGGDAAIALLGGHIDVAVMTPSSGLAQLKSGEIRAPWDQLRRAKRILSRCPDVQGAGLRRRRGNLAQRDGQDRNAEKRPRYADVGGRQDENNQAVAGFFDPQHAVVDEHLAR